MSGFILGFIAIVLSCLLGFLAGWSRGRAGMAVDAIYHRAAVMRCDPASGKWRLEWTGRK